PLWLVYKVKSPPTVAGIQGKVTPHCGWYTRQSHVKKQQTHTHTSLWTSMFYRGVILNTKFQTDYGIWKQIILIASSTTQAGFLIAVYKILIDSAGFQDVWSQRKAVFLWSQL
ncbi:hypothetical protein DPEC_G00218060, partial [Dallia pectoralis]